MKNCAYKKHPFGKWACDFMSKKELEKYAKRKTASVIEKCVESG